MKIEIGSLRVFFNKTFRILSSPSAAELDTGRFQAEKLYFSGVFSSTIPVVEQMRHFGSIYLKSQTHDDKRIQAPTQGHIKPEQRKQETN